MTARPVEACVLVVDDDTDVRESVCELVEMVGCTAIGAANGKQALDLLQQRRPCLVILDLIMPVMSGQEFLEQIGRRAELSDLSVIISTSAPAEAPAGWPVVAKPIDIGKMIDWIQRACACSRPGGAN